MSSRYGSSSDRRHSSSSSRRDSPHRHRSRHSPSPGPSSPKRESRDPKNLPESFGRGESGRTDDDLDILKRMKTSYINSPLENLYSCVNEQRKVKIWTRNYKEVRGVMTGYIIAFDKHWNLILKDVDEVFLKPKKSKTPFLREVGDKENLVDIPTKEPKVKKDSSAEAPAAPAVPPAEIKNVEGEEKKKKKRRKKAKTTSAKRQLGKFVIRGDNIVMICPLDITLVDEQERERQEQEAEEEVEEIEEGESRPEG